MSGTPDGEITVERDVMVAMRDGVRLATAALNRAERSAPPTTSTAPAPIEVVDLPPAAFEGLSRLVITNVTVIERRRSAP